nr:glycosyltransferase [Janthinobacterium sp. NKUCC08_JDC]
MLDRYSLKLLSKFDLILPISHSIIDDFNIRTPSILIQGGLTDNIISLFSDNTTYTDKKRRAVFAGALEEYNGIGILLKQWADQNPGVELHIFGKGTLAKLCQEYSEENSQIIYHGFSSHADIQKFIAQSTYVFVLRYDIGIETKYFFPSKFWESMASDAVVLCNEFSNFPDDLKQYCMLLTEDLSNLQASLANAPSSAAIATIKKRQQHMLQNHTWKSHMKKIIQYLK